MSTEPTSPDVSFPPPVDPVQLYAGTVMHARIGSKPHRFSYRVFSLLLDIDRLAEAGRRSVLFSVGRLNVASFFPKDHGDGTVADGGLRAHVERVLTAAGHSARPHRILLLCYPRLFGYVFNPISVFFCYDDAGRPSALVYEVRNTFGDVHSYVAPVGEDELSEAGIRQERDKLFYVSPFLGPELTYRFRIRPPGEDVALRMLVMQGEGPVLAATFSGRRESLTSAGVLRRGLAFPFQAVKVIAAIHLEATKLWFKGFRFHRRPAAPPRASAQGRFI